MNILEIGRRIIQARCGGRVERAHGIPHQGSYSNAAHSWGVVMLLWYLFPGHFQRLSIYCLVHDVPEGWFGDIPAPTLRYVEGMRERLHKLEGDTNRSLGLPGEDELCASDLAILKACDRLEFYLWCREQQMAGNHFVNEALAEVVRYMSEQGLPEPAYKFFSKMETRHIDIMPRQAGVVRDAVGEP